jgi:hypothetical protein
MPKKPAEIEAGTLLAIKGKKPSVSGSLQRGQTVTETLVDLNFKVPPDFRDHFKRLAFEARLKNVQLFVRAVEAWEEREAAVAVTPGKGRAAIR